MTRWEYFLYFFTDTSSMFFTLWFERKQHIRVVRLTQNSVRYLRPADILQNRATLTQRRSIVEWSHYLYFLCIQKVFSSLHNSQIKPLMADGLFWWCLSYFSGLWQCYLLGSQWDSHKPPGFHPKYLKLCSKDERSFDGFGTTWGLWLMIQFSFWSGVTL